MRENEIKNGSYVKVVKGNLSGKYYEVFDKSKEGNFITMGINAPTETINIDSVIIVSKEEFEDANQDELLQSPSFLP